MDTTNLRVERYSALKWNCPLSQSHANSLLKHLDIGGARQIIDIGCGWGELLLQAIQEHDITGYGIDIDDTALERARKEAAARNLNTQFRNMSGEEWTEAVDRAICIGSSHTLGGSQTMLKRLAEIVPRGRVLVGEMCWEKEPSLELKEGFPEVQSLIDLVKMCHQSGWEILHLDVADQREWDDFEAAHRRGIRQWLMQNGDDPKAQEIRDGENKRELEYLNVYRGRLSFVYIVLGR